MYSNCKSKRSITYVKALIEIYKNKPKTCLTPKDIKTTKHAANKVIIAVLDLKKFSVIILNVLMPALYQQLSHWDPLSQYATLQDVHLWLNLDIFLLPVSLNLVKS